MIIDQQVLFKEDMWIFSTEIKTAGKKGHTILQSIGCDNVYVTVTATVNYRATSGKIKTTYIRLGNVSR